MSAPRWAGRLLHLLAPPGRKDEVVGDLEEAHRARMQRRGRAAATLLTSLEALDMAFALLRERANPGVSWLDFKLGLRMLVRYPGLTVLGGLSMTFAIVVGAGVFEFMGQIFSPSLDLRDGDRIVGLRVWDSRNLGTEGQALYDFARWREDLSTVEELGAYATIQRNLREGEEAGDFVVAAEMSASGFRLTGVAPLLGRTLLAEDERSGAPPVLVLGHGVWRSRFGGDPDVVGRTVTLGRTEVTVVGVMPEGFAFPSVHEAWVPLRFETPPEQVAPREGPRLTFFGRLAPGAGLEEAQAEITALGRVAATASPATHEHLRPQVLPYARMVLGIPGSVSSVALAAFGVASNLPAVLFVILVCGNVALLLFARAAAREGEMVVRNALGASRRRILGQLFVEALVLAGLAAVVGLALARYGLEWWLHIVEVALWEGPLPFWFDARLSPATVAYTLGLTVLAAALAGVLPGLKITRGMSTRLREASAGGGGFRIGGVWTVVIVTQISVTVIAPAVAVAVRADESNNRGRVELPLDDTAYLTARVGFDLDTPAGVAADTTPADFAARYHERLQQLEERLTADARVAGVTFTERLPRSYHPWRQVEVDGPTAEPRDERGHRVASTAVALDYFDVLGVELRSGRAFDSGDIGDDVGAVIVNESFVESVLGGRNPIGRRVRVIATEENRDPDQEPGPWMEIVGVVEDLGTTSGYGPMGVYYPADPRETYPASVAVHLRDGADGFQPGLRAAAFAVDPGLRLHDVMTLEEVTHSEQAFYDFWASVAGGTAAIALLLSLGGIYAVMSFTVSRRTREIGIRMALGSARRRVVLDILRRPLVQVSLGLAAGGALLGLVIVVEDGLFDPRVVGVFTGYMALMTLVCLTAAVVPTRRALAVEPAEALRGE